MSRGAPAMTVAHLRRLLASPTQRRHLFRWLRSRRKDYLWQAAVPWLTFDATDRLANLLADGAQIFEYGSGGSTLFWLNHHARCTSVEHDPEWFARLRQRIGNRPDWDYRLVPPDPEPAAAGDSADPHAYCSADPAYAQRTFRRYAGQIDEFPDQHFDLVLVDGRARPSCLMHAAPKVKRGGLLVLDNAERAYYTTRAGAYLADFARREFAGVAPGSRLMTRTDLYQRR